MISATSGFNRSWKNTPAFTSARSTSRINSSIRDVMMSCGFSTSTWKPLRTAAIACSAWTPDGLPIATMSIGRCARNRATSAYGVPPASRASFSAFCRFVPWTATTSTPGIERAARACVSLMFPAPRIPTFMESGGF
ncbi:MAG: hypothetical protein DMF85_18230 [Acidobacteria bacterium]|nr:MAG: hypothetical protein DMF85_18230 [Acidobacteriota bacterium]